MRSLRVKQTSFFFPFKGLFLLVLAVVMNACADLPIVGDFFGSPLQVLYTRGPVSALRDGKTQALEVGKSLDASYLNSPKNGLIMVGVGGGNRLIVLPDSLVELADSPEGGPFNVKVVRGAVYVHHAAPSGEGASNPYTSFALQFDNNVSYVHSGGEAVVEFEPQHINLFSISGQGTWATPSLNTMLPSPRRLSMPRASLNTPINPQPLDKTGLFELYKRMDQITRQGSPSSQNIALTHKSQIDQLINNYIASQQQKAPTVARKSTYNLFLKSNLPKVGVYVNDNYKGTTPLKIPVAEGRHRVRFLDPATKREVKKLVTANEDLAGIHVNATFPAAKPKKPPTASQPPTPPPAKQPPPVAEPTPDPIPPEATEKPTPSDKPTGPATLVLSLQDKKIAFSLRSKDGSKVFGAGDFEQQKNNHSIKLEAGEYVLDARKTGFLSREWTLALEGGKTYQQAVDLGKEKISFAEASRLDLNASGRSVETKNTAGIHADSEGVFVGDSDNKVLVRFDAGGNYVSDLKPEGATLSIPTDIDRVVSENSLVISDVRRNQILILPLDSGKEANTKLLTNDFLLPGGLDHRADSGLTAIANSAQNEVVLLEGTEELRRLGDLDLSDPNDVVFLNADTIMVSDWGNLRLVKADLEGELLKEKKIDFIPAAIESAEDTYLFVADSKKKSVVVYDDNFKVLQTLKIKDSDNFEPSGLSYFDSKLYVAMTGGGFVVVFDFIHKWSQKKDASSSLNDNEQDIDHFLTPSKSEAVRSRPATGSF